MSLYLLPPHPTLSTLLPITISPLLNPISLVPTLDPLRNLTLVIMFLDSTLDLIIIYQAVNSVMVMILHVEHLSMTVRVNNNLCTSQDSVLRVVVDLIVNNNLLPDILIH